MDSLSEGLNVRVSRRRLTSGDGGVSVLETERGKTGTGNRGGGPSSPLYFSCCQANDEYFI